MLSPVIQKIRRYFHPSRGIKISAARKVEILLTYRRDLHTFVETGTEFGGTIAGVRHAFDRMHSVELEEGKYRDAVQKFGSDKSIMLYQGDSAKVLPQILKNIEEPCLIWLDAHGPGEITMDNSPVRGELQAIFAHPHHHTVLIDDARHFSFSAIREMRKMAREHGYRYELSEGLFRLT